jgi:hypothetical protein
MFTHEMVVSTNMPLSGPDLEVEKKSGLDVWAIDALDKIHK